MTLVFGEEELLAISIPEAIGSISKLILDVIRKNRALVEYYIYPNPTPSQIEAFQPRLQVLYARVESLAALDLQNLTLVADDAPWLVADFLLPILDQLLNGVHGIQELFVKHYDRALEQRKPYNTLYSTLEYRERQLKKFQADHLRNPQRRTADSLHPSTRHAADVGFCRFAVAFTNHRDHGKLSQILSGDLTSEEKERLRNQGGAYLSWDCPGCAFKLKYHVASSAQAHILATDDVRSHQNAPEVEYRPSWLVKCHLYQAVPEQEPSPTSPTSRRSSIISTTDRSRRGTTRRRQSDARSPRISNPFFFGVPRPTRSMSVENVIESRPSTRVTSSLAKYGCPFCFTIGREYGHMSYGHGRDLAEHIAARHNLGRQPSALVLEKYRVGLNGRCAEKVQRWDLNIKYLDAKQ